MKIYTTIKDGKLPKKASEILRNEIESLEGQNVTIEIKRASPINLGQWGYLYGTIYPVAASFFSEMQGVHFSIEDVDILFKTEFWCEERPCLSTDGITIQKTPKLKSKMNKQELTAYIQNVTDFLTKYGCKLPERDDDSDIIILQI